jgi:low affinity Fe/Cu permease
VHDLFHRFAQRVAVVVGSPWAFALALATILLWALAGPLIGFSTTWQLVINTGTTIVTFLIVFVIQNTQNRESESIQLKLDELIRSSKASDQLLDAEDMSDRDVAALLKRFQGLASQPLGDPQSGTKRPDDEVARS